MGRFIYPWCSLGALRARSSAINWRLPFRKVMETRQDLKDTEEYDWLESTELAIDKRKFLLNRLFVKQTVPED